MTSFRLDADRLLGEWAKNAPIDNTVLKQSHDVTLNLVRDSVNLEALAAALGGVSLEWAAELYLRFALHHTVAYKELRVVDTGAFDSRQRAWRARVMIFAGHGDTAERIADTEPDRQATTGMSYEDAYGPSAGTQVFLGLSAVASYISRSALEFHGTCPPDLYTMALVRKIPSIRPTLSRTGGSVCWRVAYTWEGRDYRVQAEVRRADLVSTSPTDALADRNARIKWGGQ